LSLELLSKWWKADEQYYKVGRVSRAIFLDACQEYCRGRVWKLALDGFSTPSPSGRGLGEGLSGRVKAKYMREMSSLAERTHLAQTF
jgi:hypothetical protein